MPQHQNNHILPPSAVRAVTFSIAQSKREPKSIRRMESNEVILTSARHLGILRSHHCRASTLAQVLLLTYNVLAYGGQVLHVFLELLEVFVLLCELLPELQELLLLTHLNSIILTGLLTLRERIPISQISVFYLHM